MQGAPMAPLMHSFFPVLRYRIVRDRISAETALSSAVLSSSSFSCLRNARAKSLASAERGALGLLRVSATSSGKPILRYSSWAVSTAGFTFAACKIVTIVTCT